MAETKIKYDPEKNKRAGFYKVDEVTDVPNRKLEDRDKKRLLRLLFELTYTQTGRKLLGDHRESQGVSTDKIRDELRKAFVNEYGIIDESLLGALIEGHLAADRWVAANAKMPDAAAQLEREKQERIYQQNMSFVMWSLWEDAMGNEFSMNW